ncbi:lrp3 [Pungitius sinensis]
MISRCTTPLRPPCYRTCGWRCAGRSDVTPRGAPRPPPPPPAAASGICGAACSTGRGEPEAKSLCSTCPDPRRSPWGSTATEPWVLRGPWRGGLREEGYVAGRRGSCFSATADLRSCTSESPASPLSLVSANSPEGGGLSPVGRPTPSEPSTPVQSDFSEHTAPPPTPQEALVPPRPTRTSRKLVLELAVDLNGVSLRRYSSLGPLSPVSPPVFPSSSQTPTTLPHYLGREVTSPPEPSKAEVSNGHFTVGVASRAIRRRDERRSEAKNRFSRFTLSDEGGDSGRETTPC